MQHQEKFSVERDDDALAEPAHTDDLLSVHCRYRRGGRTQQEGIQQPDLLQGPAENARFEAFDVDDYVG